MCICSCNECKDVSWSHNSPQIHPWRGKMYIVSSWYNSQLGYFQLNNPYIQSSTSSVAETPQRPQFLHHLRKGQQKFSFQLKTSIAQGVHCWVLLISHNKLVTAMHVKKTIQFSLCSWFVVSPFFSLANCRQQITQATQTTQAIQSTQDPQTSQAIQATDLSQNSTSSYTSFTTLNIEMLISGHQVLFKFIQQSINANHTISSTT